MHTLPTRSTSKKLDYIKNGSILSMKRDPNFYDLAKINYISKLIDFFLLSKGLPHFFLYFIIGLDNSEPVVHYVMVHLSKIGG